LTLKLDWRALLPGGLFWRTFLLIGLLLTLSLTSWVMVLRALEVAPRATQLAQHITSIVNVTRAALLHSAPARRRALLKDLAANESLRIYVLEPEDQTKALPDAPLANALREQLRNHLGTETRVEGEVNGEPGLWVSFRLDDDNYWVRIERERLERAPGVQWVFWGAAALTLSLLGATLIVNLVNKPLARLMRTARQLARGEKPTPLPGSNLREIRLVNESFNRMMKDIDRAEQERALILAGISHDLRTPLARLGLEIEMAPLPQDTKDAMSADIGQMDAIVGQFLEFARGDKAALHETFNLSAVLETLADTAARQDLQIDKHIKPNISMTGPRTDIQRLVNNLLENARKYGHLSGHKPAVEIWLRQLGQRAIIEVLDEGPGVAEADIERIKRPFARGDEARGQAKGAGLGLAIVDRIVKRLGGQWKIGNRAQGGLAVTLDLPLQGSQPKQ
jgi:two-component system osmolarity sensor histidine kinase EnvZ